MQHHTDFVVKKLCIALGVIRKLNYCVPQCVLVQVYYGIVYPYLQYAVLIWGCTAKKYLKRIQVLQNKIVKITFKSNKFKLKISPLYNYLNLLKQDKIHNLDVSKFIYEIKEKNLPNVFTISTQLLHFILTILGKQQIISIIIADETKKMKMLIKLRDMRIWNTLPNSLVKRKLKLGRKCFCKTAKKHFLNLQ